MKWIDKMATTPLLTHWYQLAAWQQTALLCALGVASLSLPAQHYWQQWTQLAQLTEQQEMQQATLAHQQKILAALKEKADKHYLHRNWQANFRQLISKFNSLLNHYTLNIASGTFIKQRC